MGVGGIHLALRGCIEKQSPVTWRENQEHVGLSKQVYQERTAGQLH